MVWSVNVGNALICVDTVGHDFIGALSALLEVNVCILDYVVCAMKN